ncbi:hypothetical protein MON38_06270 [Hymenobacter sp. DH14]|uniref:Uncharacterized protein n=1 Tax=Hymenobacter cyanobacteriorum TaxID=2926463 RepID=A0A9X1VE50_9BACT|nr:hypothetical protein [Hymenobacter cyanobacteriorum]MCI1187017.1 hypothetical protein [Hymenobacter cyanobacteriorum]
MTLPLKNLLRLALATAGFLLIPLVAMQFTKEVNWTLSDFVFAGVMVFGTGLVYQLVASRSAATPYRLGGGLALAAGFLLIWVNAAVGIIGSEHNSANLLYAGVLAVAAIGALLAQFRPVGMARAMAAAAAAQVAVPLLAWLMGRPWPATGDEAWNTGLMVGVTVLFVALWGGSAALFRWAAATGASPSRQVA